MLLSVDTIDVSRETKLAPTVVVYELSISATVCQFFKPLPEFN